MKLLSLFNNKGGVGKTTLAFHLAHTLAKLGKKTLIVDLDPQCNLTICCLETETLHEIWESEDNFIDSFDDAKNKMTNEEFNIFLTKPKTIHFLLKPTEEGTSELPNLPPAISINDNLDLIPGRLTLHKYENKISERWSGAYVGDVLSIRTITKIRSIVEEYSTKYGYDYILLDTSPSLGTLNKVIISTVDAFIIPCLPDMFSLYGIRNIGNALSIWKKEFDTITQLISEEKRKNFAPHFVRFLGYTIYNAKKYTGRSDTKWNLAQAHLNYATQIPQTIEKYISQEVRANISNEELSKPIGIEAVMHSHNTLPNMAQKYKHPIWEIPNLPNLEQEDKQTVNGNRKIYIATLANYTQFTNDLLTRIDNLV
jgi:cellulose biosynthesis protein BcsQ